MKKLFTMKGIVMIGVIVLLGTTTIAGTTLREAFAPNNGRAAIPAIIGDNVYVAWWTNNTANKNEDVLFRASTDGGNTFSDKINLSNSPNSNSSRVEISSDSDNVAVTWWEANKTTDTPVMRVSNDNGETFGPVLTLAANGTIGVTN
jgi:hypothetical protein